MTELALHSDISGPRGERVLVRRSARRRKTVSIDRRDGDLVVAIPAAFSARQEREWVTRMVDSLTRRDAARAPRAGRSDQDLMRMALELSDAHLDGRTRPASVTWSSRQNRRWGSCTPTQGTIRLSHLLRDMPDWVVRYVLMHELAHLLHSDHGPSFQALVARYPQAERARGFLDGVSHARDLGLDLEDDAATGAA